MMMYVSVVTWQIVLSSRAGSWNTCTCPDTCMISGAHHTTAACKDNHVIAKADIDGWTSLKS